MNWLAILLTFILVAPLNSVAQPELDHHQQQGLKDTQEFLKNSSERDAYIKKDAKARDIDQKVDALAGSKENKEEIYGIAAEVFEKVTAEAKGDPAVMQKLLLEAQTNPQKFYEKYFDAQSKSKLRGVANKIDKPSNTTQPRK